LVGRHGGLVVAGGGGVVGWAACHLSGLQCGRPVQGDVIRDRAVDCLKFIPYKHNILYRGYMNGQLYGGQLYGRSADSSPRIRWLVHGVL
jgi:hypothetical protein